MLVETLYNTEVESQVHDHNIEALKLIEELGLTSQLRFFKKEDNGTQSVFKYAPATNEQLFVYSTMFPNTSKIEDFGEEAIPLRVLEVLKEAKETGLFVQFGIMYERSKMLDDPILFGVTKKASYSFTVHLLARWGDSLMPYTQLKEQALARYKQKIEEFSASAITKISNLLSRVRNTNSLPEMAYNQYNNQVAYNKPELQFVD